MADLRNRRDISCRSLLYPQPYTTTAVVLTFFRPSLTRRQCRLPINGEDVHLSGPQSDESHMEISLDTAPALLRSAIRSKGRGVCLGMGGGVKKARAK